LRRRDFLKTTTLAAGVALIEGCRGAEEQFLVQPVRRPLRPLPSEGVWLPSVCRQCAAGCGIRVRVVDGDAKKVEGNPDHPVNRGGVCALGQSLLQELYNPDRILAPQRRTGERGAGEFQGISWEDGLREVVEAVAATPPARIALIGAGGAGLTGALVRRLAAALGSPPPAFVEAPELAVERQAAQLALGLDDLPYFDIARSDYVLSIGASFLDRWRSPVHYTRAFAEMRRGRPGRRGKLVQAEARMSLTAANADEWLAVRPGAKGVLARTLAGLLLADPSVDERAKDRYRALFPAEPPGLEEGAEACDVPPERIRRIAAELAAAEGRLVIAGGSAAAHSNGLYNVTAGLALNVLLGNLGAPGGVFAPASFGLERGIAPEGIEAAPAAELAARLGGESGEPVEVLIVVDADPIHRLPRGWGLREGIASVGKIVSLSSFRDDTTLFADVVLPLNTELERFDVSIPETAVGVAVAGVAQPVVEPLGDGRHPADVLLGLAAALGEPIAGQFPWPSFAGLVEVRVEAELAGLPGGEGMTAASYIRQAVARGGIFAEGPPAGVPPGPEGAAFGAEDMVQTAEAAALADRPAPPGPQNTASGPAGATGGGEGAAQAPPPPPAVFDGAAADYPFILLPFESVKIGEGRGANRPWLQELPDPFSTVMWDTWLEISPVDARSLGVREGDLVRMTSPTGEIEAKAVVDPAVRPGVIGVPLGQGHADYGRYARGRGANPMDLLGSLEVEGTRSPAWAATRVRLERLGPGRLARFGRSYEQRGEGEAIPVGWAPQRAWDRNGTATPVGSASQDAQDRVGWAPQDARDRAGEKLG